MLQFYGFEAAILLVPPGISQQQLFSWLSDRHTGQSEINMKLGDPLPKGHSETVNVLCLIVVSKTIHTILC